MIDVSEDLEALVSCALEDADAGGKFWNVALGESVVVKVPDSEDVSKDIVRENICRAENLGISYADTEIHTDLGDSFVQIQERGGDFLEYIKDDEPEFIRQAVGIMDHVAMETDYVIDAKPENFVVIDGTVCFCDLGDGGSISRLGNDHMYDKFISSYRRQMDQSLEDVETLIGRHSDYFDSRIAEIYSD